MDNDDLISKRAYELWERAGQPAGQAEHFWRLGSKEVVAEQAPKPTLRERLSAYSMSDMRSLKLLGARMSYEFYEAERSVQMGGHGARPGTLWYYTTGATFASMLSSREIWATQVSCLSDRRVR